MDKKVWTKLALGTCLAATSIPVFAAGFDDAPDSKWYVRGGIGPSFTENTTISLSQALPADSIKFDPGVRALFGGGYQFCDYFSLEGEIGVIGNSVKSIAGSSDVDADLSQIPLMANVVFQYPNRTGFTPYIGAGLGFSTTVLNIDYATIQGVNIHGDDAAVAFAYQGFAGVRYEFNKRLSIGLGYRYFATDHVEWDVRSDEGGHVWGTLNLHNPDTHSAIADVVFRF